MGGDDEQLLGAWRSGDRAAGEELARRYFERVFAFFASKVGGEAEDLTQKTFLACVQQHRQVTLSFRGYSTSRDGRRRSSCCATT